MSWPIREELKSLSANLPEEILDKIDMAVEFLRDTGASHATRAHVVEFAIDSQLASGAKAYLSFRKWKKEQG